MNAIVRIADADVQRYRKSLGDIESLLLAARNADQANEVRARIEAAKALLPYFERPAGA